MRERIVITGLGCLTAAGHTVEETWSAIKDGKSGIDKISAWDVSDWEYNTAAEIKNLDLKKLIDRKLLKLLSRHDVIGLGAADQALQHSGLLKFRESLADPTGFNEMTGIYVSSAGGKFNQQYDYFPLLTQAENNLQRFGADLNSVVHPMWLLRTLPNNVLGHAAIQYNFKGANQNIVNHSVGGTQAILEAADVIRRGVIDRALVVGYDVMVEPQTYMYYAALGVISKTGIHSFDQERNGTVLADGAGALVLESLSSAKARGATIYGEILGGTTTTEAMGIFPIREDGAGLTHALQETLQRTQLSPDQIGMISAHGNGTVASDAVEALVYSSLFANSVITGFKWALGHTFAASGVIETIFTLLALKEKSAPGIANLKQKPVEFNNLKVSASPQAIEKNTALVVSRGFASMSSCLAVAL